MFTNLERNVIYAKVTNEVVTKQHKVSKCRSEFFIIMQWHGTLMKPFDLSLLHIVYCWDITHRFWSLCISRLEIILLYFIRHTTRFHKFTYCSLIGYIMVFAILLTQLKVLKAPQVTMHCIQRFKFTVVINNLLDLIDKFYHPDKSHNSLYFGISTWANHFITSLLYPLIKFRHNDTYACVVNKWD